METAAFKMVVGLLSPQIFRFSHTVTVFDSPALPNNCHKRLIIHYRFFWINISSVTDVNASLGCLCHRLTASPKFISSLLLYTSVNQLTSFPDSFLLFIVFRFRLDSCQLFNYNENIESYLFTLLSKPHP